VGFEPTVQFPVHSISSAASSATPAPLQKLPIADLLLPIEEGLSNDDAIGIRKSAI
jgi:hypothetical protein